MFYVTNLLQLYFITVYFRRFAKSGVEHFPWVQPDSDDDEEEEKNLRAKELFMSGDSTMVTVGGG